MHLRNTFGLLLVVLAGCQLPPERQAMVLLPDDAPAQGFLGLADRARYQASAANEAFYINRWGDLEDAAKALEQTAKFLSKCTDAPVRHKDKLPVEAGDLGKEAALLRDAAKNQNEKLANQSLQVINLAVRRLRQDN